MILCLDVGNTNIFGGVFQGENIELRFRYDTKQSSSSDQLGLFLSNVLIANTIDPKKIKQIAVCSVVPSTDYSLRAACKKYFRIDPFFIQSGTKTGLNLQVKNPNEVGADRIANAIAAISLYPKKNLIIIDLGTATTFCAITAEKRYLGGAIMPGIRIAMESLSSKTAKLSAVEIVKPIQAIGRDTASNIQSGLYYGQLGAMREMTKLFIEEQFAKQPPVIIGTGGFTHLFSEEKLFDIIVPDLVLYGLKLALELNN